MKFRHKPTEIEARQWFDTDAHREEFAQWFEDNDQEFMTRGPIAIVDGGGWMTRADPGDWIAYDDECEEFRVYTAAQMSRLFEAAEAVTP